MRFGFAKVEITPRVGVELCGFGPYVLRRSVGIRDRLWARAMAVESEGARAVLGSCDLVGLSAALTGEARRLVEAATGLPNTAVMLHCTHTHSGPSIGEYIGWAEADAPYLALLPGRIARACAEALGNLQPATLSHAVVPCEGVGINREQEQAPDPWQQVLADDWRPQRPELTDTECQVFKVETNGRLAGFASYFGCHPVVCCADTRYIHGDYCGVATNLLEREHPGAVGLFLQGAEGDVNSCVVHKPEQESLLALDVIASRYARAVRSGLAAALPVEGDCLRCISREVTFSRKPWGREHLVALLAEQAAVIHAPDAADADGEVRMAVVRATALRQMIGRLDTGQSLQPPTELQGLRIGPISFLGTPFEVFQRIKNEVVAESPSPLPLVLSQTNDSLGYAVEREVAARGGYAADLVPLIIGSLPFADLHGELMNSLRDLDRELAADCPPACPD
ncbi:MAG: hypothetical protein AUJ96_02760 [Armatimonadetes bacterium CG2_30_66_41]|nr:hypothetical protein [Armatimonadota bacterium]NCP29986.1 hypothetical protein [Armatimonadota bacterium]NCQ27705.1 hypothetical protein [Armatimonadota bacterium]NDK11163.1 hypothetical protein [Armatimonadota bacterium]OIP11203.1 MAG: hypothetical protein AUJ96_02760 [Armatimonadetes bacterium CG2_30_66_41]